MIPEMLQARSKTNAERAGRSREFQNWGRHSSVCNVTNAVRQSRVKEECNLETHDEDCAQGTNREFANHGVQHF